ncbi:MAG: SulP family inorganic anion transporter [Burkholderiaceae bacterium]|nr:SulP family inorganic anion transporter [Burkholderiaceae bacterium]
MAKPRLRPAPRWQLPLLTQLQDSTPHTLKRDVVAGLTVCVVMIPSVIAYAELLHLPPVAGLYSALAACVAYALCASSRQVVAGPDAAIGLLAGTAILPLAGGDPVRTAMLAAELAALSALVLLLAARLNLGAIADLLSRPVLIGYLNGASLILVSTQLGKLFGLPLGGEEFFPTWRALWESWPATHLPTLLIGLALIATLVALDRWWPRVPAALAVSALAVAAAWLLGLPDMGVAMVEPVPGGLPLPSWPEVWLSDIQALAPAAMAIAFLAFSDGIVLAQTFADKHHREFDANQELVALGASNAAAALLQGFPVSASQSRTSVVDAAGGQTQVAQLVAAAGLLLFLLVASDLVAMLPKVALGAILIVTALSMVEVASLSALYRIDRRDFWLALAVMLSILVAGVVPGILLGMLLSLIGVLVEISRPRDAVLSRRDSDGKFHDVEPNAPNAHTVPGLMVYRLYAPLIFANARFVVNRLRTLTDAAAPPLQWLVIDAQAITDMDMTAAQRFASLCRELAMRGIVVKIADAPRPFREELHKVGVVAELGEQPFYVSVKTAVEAFESQQA